AGAEDAPAARRILLVHLQASGLHRLVGGDEVVLRVLVEPPALELREELVGLPAPHLAGELGRVLLRVEAGDRAAAPLALQQLGPGGGEVEPERADRTETGDDDAPSCHAGIGPAVGAPGGLPRAPAAAGFS